MHELVTEQCGAPRMLTWSWGEGGLELEGGPRGHRGMAGLEPAGRR